MYKMAKNSPNHVPMIIIGLAQTSPEILKDGDVPIFPVVISTPDSLQLILNHHCDHTSTLLSTLCLEVNTICIWPEVQCQCATAGHIVSETPHL